MKIYHQLKPPFRVMQMQQPQTTYPFHLDNSTKKYKTSSVASRKAKQNILSLSKCFRDQPMKKVSSPSVINYNQGMPQLQTTLVLSSMLQLKHRKAKLERVKSMRNVFKKNSNLQTRSFLSSVTSSVSACQQHFSPKTCTETTAEQEMLLHWQQLVSSLHQC